MMPWFIIMAYAVIYGLIMGNFVEINKGLS